MYRKTTHSIEVTVRPDFLEDQSEPMENRYVWAYHVRIKNKGSNTVQVLGRHWNITDSFGRTQEVRGQGVIGEQPVIKPGEAFEYTSGTPLQTPSGIMVGTYFIEVEGGAEIEVPIPAFSLDSPHDHGVIH